MTNLWGQYLLRLVSWWFGVGFYGTLWRLRIEEDVFCGCGWRFEETLAFALFYHWAFWFFAIQGLEVKQFGFYVHHFINVQ